MQWDALAFLPHPTDITDIAPPPDHSPLFASIRWPGQAGLTSAGSVAAGSDGCLLGRIHFPCGYVVYVLLCCWGVFPVLTLYSPRSIVWGLFFSPHFPHVNAVFFFNSTCISLLIILVWLCMWRIIKNLEIQQRISFTYHRELTRYMSDSLAPSLSVSLRVRKKAKRRRVVCLTLELTVHQIQVRSISI